MVDRRNTPDILGDLLGGSPPPAPSNSQKEAEKSSAKQSGGLSEVSKSTDLEQKDPQYFENLLEHAASALVLVGQVLGHQRLVAWLDEMRDIFASDETVAARKAPEESFKQSTANWAERRLGAKTTDIHYKANGLAVTDPYEVDVWAHFKGEGAQSDLDVWLECRDVEEPVRKSDIMKFVQKGTDVFHAAHTGKQDFWFDRLILVSTSSFDVLALELADQVGVTCVSCDDTTYEFQSNPNWKLKPGWLRDAEASEGITWHKKPR
ncbi:MAG: hypothetical protein R6U37_07230 [Dehalococcoidia bacterium]